MKRFLLSLSFLGAVLFGHSQVVLNEVYVDPASNKGHSEFFELYNTSILPTPINLDCYTLVSYKWAKNGSKTLFVIDLPKLSINPKSYFVGAAATPLNVQGKTNQPLNFSWSDPNLSANGGSIKKYVLNPNGTDYTISDPTPPESRDIFYTNDNTNTVTSYGIFLFNNGVYVNGFIGGYSSSTPPAEITSLPAITNLSNTCGTYSITFSSINKNEFVGAASGTDNGYIRQGDGLCGTWVKASNNHTPGVANPGSTTSTSASTLTTTQKLICGNRIDFSITAPTTGITYPVEVQLYIDKNKDGRLDATDEYVSTYPQKIGGGSNTVYSFTSLAVLPSNWQYLVVYVTALNCFDKLVVPTASSGTLSTKELNICGNQIDFSVFGATGEGAAYGLPLQVQLYEDKGTIAAYDPGVDVAIGSPVTVTSVSNTTYSIPIPAENKGKLYILVYTSPNSCYSKTVVPQLAQGNINTTQLSICGNQIDFKVLGVTGDATAGYVFPITVNLYQDLDGDQVLDADEMTPIGTTQVTEFSPTKVYSLINPNPSLKTLIQYNAAQPCFTPFPPVAPRAAVGGLATTARNICGSQIDFTTTGPSGDATADYVFPITVELHYDLNGNQVLDIDEMNVEATKVINSFSTEIQTIANPDPTKKVILVYKTKNDCFSTNQFATPTTGALTVTQNYFCGKRVNFTIPGGTEDAANYSLPITVSVYHDADGNGQLNENTSDPTILLGRKTITAFSNNEDFIALAEANWGKAVIVEYKAAYNCFTAVVAPQVTTTGPVSVGGNIPGGNSTVNYFIVNGAADAYPLQINVYEDANRNGQIDNGENIIATENLNTAPAPNTVYTATLQNDRSYAIVVAKSTVGCSQDIEVILNSQAPLPVTYKSFTATRSGNKVALTWETAMEENNRGFHIQRNMDGSWKDIAFVFTQAENGNSSEILKYSYNDINNSKGITQYRILQVDMDGKGRYSEIRAVKGEAQASKVMVYPNPSHTGSVNLLFEDATSLRDVIVSDVAGRVVKQYRAVSSSSLVIENLVNGYYTLQIINHTTAATTVEKVIIKKR